VLAHVAFGHNWFSQVPWLGQCPTNHFLATRYRLINVNRLASHVGALVVAFGLCLQISRNIVKPFQGITLSTAVFKEKAKLCSLSILCQLMFDLVSRHCAALSRSFELKVIPWLVLSAHCVSLFLLLQEFRAVDIWLGMLVCHMHCCVVCLRHVLSLNCSSSSRGGCQRFRADRLLRCGL